MARTVKGYGWRPDFPDHRDLLFHERNELLPESSLPQAVDLAPHCPPIYNQGQLGSCTGNGWARVMQYMAKVDGDAALGAQVPSRLFLYYEERVIDGTVDQDAGAQVRDGAQVVSSLGAPPESLWPYDIGAFAEKPPPAAYAAATHHKALQYQRVIPGVNYAMRNALNKGLPIVFGFSVPDYFETGWDYTTPLPLPGPATQIVGGHCVVITGYDFSCTRFRVPAFQCDNSWGFAWGVNGRFWMEWDWFDVNRGLAADLWVVQQVS